MWTRTFLPVGRSSAVGGGGRAVRARVHVRLSVGEVRGGGCGDSSKTRVSSCVVVTCGLRSEKNAALSIAAPAFAEGTGEALGVDDGRLLIPVLLIPVLVFVTYQGFAAEQDNEDFFDTYDQRRK